MTKFLSKDGKFYMRDGKLLGYTPPQASLTPQTGITYTDGLPSDWNIMKEIGMAISEASENINANTTGNIYINKGNMWAYKITPGDTISVNNNTYAVMGFNNFALTNQGNYGGTHNTAGLTFGAVDCVGTSIMNYGNTNRGGWRKCEMRITALPSLQSGMPDTLAQVKVPYVNYGQSAILYSDDYLFLPAEKEVSGTRKYSIEAEANALTQFAYYNSSSNFCNVAASGKYNNNYASTSLGAAPCFCV